MNRAQQLLLEGHAALNAKRYEDAEGLLMAAFQAYPPDDLGRRTACFNLGIMYRKTGRDDEAINLLEKALPLPASFTELAKMYRGWAKQMKKDGDAKNAAEWLRRMYCLAKLSETVFALRTANNGMDWVRAGQWLDDVRRQCGSLYPYEFDGQPIPGDKLLSPTDYKALAQAFTGRGA